MLLQQEKTELKDEQCLGYPWTSVTEVTVVHVLSIIDKDSTVTLRFLSLELAQDIMLKHLGLREKCAPWVPHLLMENKIKQLQLCHLWVMEFEANDLKQFSDDCHWR